MCTMQVQYLEHIHHLWNILGDRDFKVIKVDILLWRKVKQLSINKSIWIISLQHAINKRGLDKSCKGELRIYSKLIINPLAVCNKYN